jgi:protein arginine kinase
MPRRSISDSEAWKRMVLRSMPPPAWLGKDAPEGDVVVSSRVRFARNLDGIPVPHLASDEELATVRKRVLEAAKPLDFEVLKHVSEAERDYLIGCRLVSPDFETRGHGRALLLDRDRSVSIMVNEEDHLRIQALTAGWSVETAGRLAEHVLNRLEGRPDTGATPFDAPKPQSAAGLTFARIDTGYVTASPTNHGEGKRLSALFHLIGLAHAKRLPAVLTALGEMGQVARGIYGEVSRGVGAFIQVSSTTGPLAHFAGAAEYLLREERQARREVPRDQLAEQARAAIEFAIASNQITLADALRVLAWARWAASSEIEGFAFGYRDVDLWVSTLEVRSTHDEAAAARHRASFLRERLG